MGKTKAQIEKEFNEFAEKIAKLESLKHELDALDTKGFEGEVKLIKAKLKDIGAISSITRSIGDLRRKIEKKHSGGSDAAVSLKRKISHLESMIAEKKRTAGARQLSGKEVADVKDIPKLESELHKMRKSFEEHMSKSNVKVDSGVGLIVDSKFDDFISELKADLTERLKEEEKLLREQEQLHLRADLERRKELFAEKTHELANKEKEKEIELKDNLKKEEAQEERKLEKKQEVLSKKAKELNEREEKDEEMLRNDLQRRKREFAQKYAALVKKAHNDYKKRVENELKREVGRKFNSELRSKVSEIKAKVVEDTKRKVLLSLMDENKKKLDFETRKTAQKLGSETKNVISRLKAKMHNEMIAKVKSEVKKKKHELKRKLEQDYKKKLEMESKIKQAEMEKKKAQLEAYVAEQAKKIFK